ncbi:CHC2 zinc finger domain-containing protein [Plantactinospora sp. WMMB782]|uniref:CHC2 zinc finger domain-containing protein n=1 Tax=Plantactinospora sp. WMMB782 TaxID=3404121 RepID=UPI003B940091
MTWRPIERLRGRAGGELARPSLPALLDHYGVQYSPVKTRQMIRCPLHEDRTPSCSLDLDRELWHCMSCGKAGSSWDLIMQREGLTFREAVKHAEGLDLASGSVGGQTDSETTGSLYGGRRRKPSDRARGASFRPTWKRR